MTKSIASIAMLTAVLFAACATATGPSNSNANIYTPIVDPQNDAPASKHQYKATRGGVQITKIYYNQGANSTNPNYMLNDEWIVLEANRNVSTRGWMLDANDPGQRYSLPDTIYRRLYIYTQKGPESGASNTVMILGKKSWIWNNEEPDIARLYDADGELVDSMTYIGK